MERAGLLGGVQMRSLQPDETNRLSGEILEKAIKEDLEAGLIPFYVSQNDIICNTYSSYFGYLVYISF